MAASTRKILRVFLASPGGLEEERERARKVVCELNQDLAAPLGWYVDLIGWEDTAPGYGRPQDIINRELDSADVFLGVLHKRWGSPTAGGYDSGFEEEYHRAIARRRISSAPEIVIAFKHVKDVTDPGPQLRRVLQFRRELETSKELYFAPKSIGDIGDWERLLRKTLYRFVLPPAQTWSSHAAVEGGSKASPVRETQLSLPAEVRREIAWVEAYNLGIAEMEAGDIRAARSIFIAADRLYQERPEARIRLGRVEMRLGNTKGAVQAYSGALSILYGGPPEGLNREQLQQWNASIPTVALNLAQTLAQSGQPEEAVDVIGALLERHSDLLGQEFQLRAITAQADFLAQAGRGEEAQTMMDAIRVRPGLGSDEYFQLGVGYFNAGDYKAAAEAFAMAAELNPYNRDALLNTVQSLYSQAVELEEADPFPAREARLAGIYGEILDAAEQVRSFDPLNRNVLSFMLRAYRGQGNLAKGAEVQMISQRSQVVLREYQGLPYEVSEISLNLQQDDQAAVTGVLTNLSSRQGDEVRLRFTAVDVNGQTIDSVMARATAPATGESVQFSTELDLSGREFAGWRYAAVV